MWRFRACAETEHSELLLTLRRFTKYRRKSARKNRLGFNSRSLAPMSELWYDIFK